MSKVRVLLEFKRPQQDAFSAWSTLSACPAEAVRASEGMMADLVEVGVEVSDEIPPVPLFGRTMTASESPALEFADFASDAESPDREADSMVVAAEVSVSQLADLQHRSDLNVWPDAELVLLSGDSGWTCSCGGLPYEGLGIEEPADAHPLDLARSAGGVDCRPFRPGVSIDTVRQLLAVDAVWRDGFRGQNIIAAILDEGVNGQVYPVVGGLGGSSPLAPRPGSASIRSHGSMVAADILVAAPAAKLHDYPFMRPFAASVLDVLQHILENRRLNGAPHVLNNSWGFKWRSPNQEPGHPNWDPNHPVNRKFREVIASGAPVLFAAGNCGQDCPSGKCVPQEVGPGNSITGPSSLDEVISVAAVNSRHERVGYSSQGPGKFTEKKPDVACYTHLLGNFGPGRPGGTPPEFDNGTSAATPVATGVVALLQSALGATTFDPAQMKRILVETAINLGPPGWDRDTGHGVVNAGAAYALAKRRANGRHNCC